MNLNYKNISKKPILQEHINGSSTNHRLPLSGLLYIMDENRYNALEKYAVKSNRIDPPRIFNVKEIRQEYTIQCSNNYYYILYRNQTTNGKLIKHRI